MMCVMIVVDDAELLALRCADVGVCGLASPRFTAALHKRWFQVMLALLSVVWTWSVAPRVRCDKASELRVSEQSGSVR
eukprot:1092974-Rhodomonas_salina.2